MDFSLPVASGTFPGSSVGMAVIEMGGSHWNFVFISSRSRDMPGVEPFGSSLGVSPINNVCQKIVLPTQRLVNEQDKENLVHSTNNIKRILNSF